MKVFITGASGFIGSAVTAELIAAGHTVLGLARSDESAAKLTVMGAEVHLGNTDDLDSVRAGAEASEGVIHLAFDHSFTDMADAAAKDLRTIQTIGAALEGTNKPFVGTSGTMMVAGLGHIATEKDFHAGGEGRVLSENTVIGLAEKGVRSSVIRLSPSVHGDNDHGFVPTLINIAREKGSSYVGDGASRWPAVHVLDAAHLYRLALESAPAGTRLHGVGDEGIPFREIAEAIAKGLRVPAQSIPPEDASELSFLGMFVQMDNPVSNAYTQELLGWKPTHPGLIADLEGGHYFTK